MNNTGRFLVVFSTLFIISVLQPGPATYAQDDTSSVSSHFVFPEFIEGKVKMKNGTTEDAILNYNMLTEEMIFESDSERLALVKIETIDTIYIRSRKFIPHDKVFYEVLINDTVSLFVRHKRNVLSSGSPAGYGGTTETGAAHSISHLVTSGNIYNLELSSEYHLTDASQFWITLHNSSFRISSERQILKIFPEISGELKQFIIQNHLNIKKQHDLHILIMRCNEIMH
jgi:hypothetical protein